MQHVLFLHTSTEFQILSFKLGDKHVCIVNMHLPDESKCRRADIPLESVLERLSAELDSLWGLSPWHALAMCGDLNTEFVQGGVFGKGVSALRMSDRSLLVQNFAAKYMLNWTSTFVEEDHVYTHVCWHTKDKSVLDYVLHAGVEGCKVSCACEIDHDAVFDSDHSPIRFELCGWHAGKFCRGQGQQARDARRARTLGSRMNEPLVQNRFAALMCEEWDKISEDTLASSKSTLEYMCECLHTAQTRAALETPKQANKDTLAEYCKDELLDLAEAVGEARRPALNALNRKKKAYFRERAKRKLRSTSLSKPRTGSEKQSGIFPLRINGIMTNNPQEWQPAFTALYRQLFRDDDNTEA
jgi:hypothetical protein